MPVETDQIVALIGPDGQHTNKQYKILDCANNVVRLLDIHTGHKLRVHKTRIVDQPQRREQVSKKSKAPKKAEQEETPKDEASNTNETFDVAKFVAENGGEHWVRGEDGGTKFDHPEYKLITHAVLDEQNGHYFMINLYEKNGIASLGKGSKGITEYPLKGNQINYTVSQTAKKVESRGQKRVRKGIKTAEEVRKHWLKSGYVERAL